ncbi:MAG: hypothetical protein FWG97_03705, partial [Deltaproteobacteria bacterium]|nr:hypothetical protein [Deltaproteobacteria bacterium]
MSIRLKALIMIVLVVTALITSGFFVSLYFTNQSLGDTIEQDLSFAIEVAEGLISAKIQLIKSKAAHVAERLLKAASPEEMQAIMRDHILECPECTSLSVFDRNGLIAYHGRPITPGEILSHSREIERVLNEGITILTSPFYRPDTGEFVIYVFRPLDSGRILSLSQPGLMFSDLVSSYKLWETGNIYVINEQGTLIADVESELVLNQRNYIVEAEENPNLMNQDGRGIGDLLRKALADEKGMGAYRHKGTERLCFYRNISGSSAGWHVLVDAPLNESPRANVRQRLALAAVFLLAMGSALSVVISGFVTKPYKELEKLHNTIRLQANRIKILLDSTPISCRLWKKDIQVFDCNEETLRLFNMKSKQEFFENYSKLFPEYQPDGSPSKEKSFALLTKALEGETIVDEWTYQLPDGTLLPTELTLVRVPYEGGHAVAGYARDLREYKKMMKDIDQRDALLNIVNQTATIMLQTDCERFADDLRYCMGMMARAIDVDRICIWKNDNLNGTLHCTKIYEWSARNLEMQPDGLTLNVSYDDLLPGWEDVLSNGFCINKIVSQMSLRMQTHFAPQGISSIFVSPIFLQDEFWGYIRYDDCLNRRVFNENEQIILRSGSIIIANALLRNEIMQKVHAASAKLEAVISNYSGIIWNVDRNRIIRLLNGCHIKKFGLSPSTFEGWNLDAARKENEKLKTLITNIEETIEEGAQDW